MAGFGNEAKRYCVGSIFGWPNRNQGNNCIVHTKTQTETFACKIMWMQKCVI